MGGRAASWLPRPRPPLTASRVDDASAIWTVAFVHSTRFAILRATRSLPGVAELAASGAELVLDPGRALGAGRVVEALGGVVVGRGRPLEVAGAALAGDLEGGLDQGPADAAPRACGSTKRSFISTVSAACGRGEVPVEAGVADQLAPPSRGAEQQSRPRWGRGSGGRRRGCDPRRSPRPRRSAGRRRSAAAASSNCSSAIGADLAASVPWPDSVTVAARARPRVTSRDRPGRAP